MDSNTLAIFVAVAVAAVAVVALFRRKGPVRLTLPGGAGVDAAQASPHPPAIDAERFKTKGSLDANDSTGHGIRLVDTEVEGDASLTTGLKQPNPKG